jgi:endonuclease/exonuclease/phosphatase family metal-dependent hydrolase
MTSKRRIRNRIFLTLPLTLLISLSCADQPKPVRAPFAARNVLRFLSINVWSGLDYTGYLKMGEYETKPVREKRYQALISQIKQLNPDVVGVQEANKLPEYAERLAKDLGYDVVYHVGLGGVRLGAIGLPWNLREGDALLAKKDLRMEFVGRQQLTGGYVGNFFTFHFSDATQILGVRIFNRDKPIYVFVTHWHASLLETPELQTKARELKSAVETWGQEYEIVLTKIRQGENRRMIESQKTVEFIKKMAQNQPSILMGDFNALPGSREIQYLLQSGMVDVFRTVNPDLPGYTWNPTTNLNYKVHYSEHLKTRNKRPDLYAELNQIQRATPKRIDYIFLGPTSILQTKEISVKLSRIVLDGVIAGVHASDHYGVLAEIGFK